MRITLSSAHETHVSNSPLVASSAAGIATHSRYEAITTRKAPLGFNYGVFVAIRCAALTGARHLRSRDWPDLPPIRDEDFKYLGTLGYSATGSLTDWTLFW